MLTLLLAVYASTVQPATLWENVEAGMTFVELKKVRPAARPISAAEKRDWLPACEIADDKVTIQGVVLDLCYATQDGKVSAVLLHSPLKDHGGAANRFKPALASKYGPPLMDFCGGFDRMAYHQTCTTVWHAGKVTISNQRMTLAKRNMITLEFRPRPSQH
jgi:hypothetical protein